MLKRSLNFLIIPLLFLCYTCFAGGGVLFNVQESGDSLSQEVSFNLCLVADGKRPLSCQNYTAQAATITMTTTMPNHSYRAAGIKINTPGYSYSPGTPASSGYLLLGEISNTQAVTGTLRATTAPTVQYTYVSDASSNLWQCLLNSAGGINGACTSLTPSPGFLATMMTSFNTYAGATYSYLADNSNTLWQCPINSTTGGFSGNCQAIAYPFNAVSAATLYTFAGQTYLYVADQNTVIWRCPINRETGMLSSSCTALTNSNGGFNAPTVSVNFSTFSGITYAYVCDYTDTVWKCPMNSQNGTFNTCTALTNNVPFNQTNQVSFQTFSGLTYLYVADMTANLWKCPLDSATGGFSGSCTALGSSTFNMTNSANFNTTAGITYAYVGDGSNKLYQCPMSSNGNFSGACIAHSNFNASQSAAFWPVEGR